MLNSLWDLATLPYSVACDMIFSPDKVAAVLLTPATFCISVTVQIVLPSQSDLENDPFLTRQFGE